MKKLSKKIADINGEIYRLFGTKSYEIRCELYDVEQSVKHIPSSSDTIGSFLNWYRHRQDLHDWSIDIVLEEYLMKYDKEYCTCFDRRPKPINDNDIEYILNENSR